MQTWSSQTEHKRMSGQSVQGKKEEVNDMESLFEALDDLTQTVCFTIKNGYYI